MSRFIKIPSDETKGKEVAINLDAVVRVESLDLPNKWQISVHLADKTELLLNESLDDFLMRCKQQ